MICLMYHRLASWEDYRQVRGAEQVFTLPVERFEQQIEYLARTGYTFVTADQVRQYVIGELALPGPAVLITFDDGCLSVRRLALPVLRKHGVRATMFVTTDLHSVVFQECSAADRRLTDEELREVDSDTLRVESHGVTHRPLRGLSEDEVRWELTESKRELQRVLGREMLYFAIPGNWFDARVMRIAHEVGYQAVWCSNPGRVRVGMTLFGLPRLNVEGPLTLPQFAASIRPWGILQRRAVSWIKRAPRRVLGPRYWLPIRKAILACVPGHYLSVRRLMMLLAAGALLLAAAVYWILRSRLVGSL